MTATATAIEPGTLTKDDVKALRTCERAVFSTAAGEMTGTIACRRDNPNPGPFGDAEREHIIATDAHGTYYNNDDTFGSVPLHTTGRRAWSLQYNYEHTPTTFGTLAALVRTGDRLTLRWIAGGGNEYEKRAQLYRDSLSVEVRRGTKTLVFLIDVSVCPDNTARMIRR